MIAFSAYQLLEKIRCDQTTSEIILILLWPTLVSLLV